MIIDKLKGLGLITDKHSDCGLITAYKSRYKALNNYKRNSNLLAKLLTKRYKVVSICGTYIENYDTPYTTEIGNHLYFVHDFKDRGRLKNDLISLARIFNQNYFLYISANISKALIVDMNTQNKLQTEIDADSLFTILSIIRSHKLPAGFFGRWSCHVLAKKNWKNINISNTWADTLSFSIRKLI